MGGNNCNLYYSLGGFSVFGGVGERTREGADLYHEMQETVSIFEFLYYCAISYGTSVENNQMYIYSINIMLRRKGKTVCHFKCFNI